MFFFFIWRYDFLSRHLSLESFLVGSMLTTAGVRVCMCRCMWCIKRTSKCTSALVSCASVVCLISLAGCVCNFTIKAHAVFLLFLVLLHCLSLSSLSLHWNYLRAFGSWSSRSALCSRLAVFIRCWYRLLYFPSGDRGYPTETGCCHLFPVPSGRHSY